MSYKLTQVPANPSNYTHSRWKPVTHIVIHWIVGSLASADATFKNPSRNASAHYGVENKNVHQWVKETHIAWHAGSANPYSIGIEHSAAPGRKATSATYQSSGELVRKIAKKYKIPLTTSRINPHNKYMATQCPGTMDIKKIISIAKGVDTVAETWYTKNINSKKVEIVNLKKTVKAKVTEIVRLKKNISQQASQLKTFKDHLVILQKDVKECVTTMGKQRVVLDKVRKEVEVLKERLKDRQEPPEKVTRPPRKSFWELLKGIFKI